jgi:hypothetical protein
MGYLYVIVVRKKEHFCIMYPTIIIDYGSSMFG